jgi:4a-hydroxytetrahydrobiopterin dehydratase
MKPLPTPEVKAGLAAVPAWTRARNAIRRTFEFTDFPAAMKFVNAVARAAEKAGHHPDIDIRWNRVALTLTTHDVGGLTALDFELARRCDMLAG